MLPGDADLLTRGPHFEYTRDSRSSPPPPGVLTPRHSVQQPCSAPSWSSAGRGGAEGGAGGVARAPRGSCRRSLQPLGEAAELRQCRRGRVRRGRGLWKWGGRRTSPRWSRPLGSLAAARWPTWQSSSSRPPPLITSCLSLPAPSPPNPPPSKRLRKREVVHGAAECALKRTPARHWGHGQQHGHQTLLRQPLR